MLKLKDRDSKASVIEMFKNLQGRLLSPAFSTGTLIYPIECLAKGPHRNPQTAQAVAKTVVCSLFDIKAPLLTTTPTQLIEHGEVKLVPM